MTAAGHHISCWSTALLISVAQSLTLRSTAWLSSTVLSQLPAVDLVHSVPRRWHVQKQKFVLKLFNTFPHSIFLLNLLFEYMQYCHSHDHAYTNNSWSSKSMIAFMRVSEARERPRIAKDIFLFRLYFQTPITRHYGSGEFGDELVVRLDTSKRPEVLAFSKWLSRVEFTSLGGKTGTERGCLSLLHSKSFSRDRITLKMPGSVNVKLLGPVGQLRVEKKKHSRSAGCHFDDVQQYTSLVAKPFCLFWPDEFVFTHYKPTCRQEKSWNTYDSFAQTLVVKSSFEIVFRRWETIFWPGVVGSAGAAKKKTVKAGSPPPPPLRLF